ncbi:unnamed protein product [Chrysoparadoxa australica]
MKEPDFEEHEAKEQSSLDAYEAFKAMTPEHLLAMLENPADQERILTMEGVAAVLHKMSEMVPVCTGEVVDLVKSAIRLSEAFFSGKGANREDIIEAMHNGIGWLMNYPVKMAKDVIFPVRHHADPHQHSKRREVAPKERNLSGPTLVAEPSQGEQMLSQASLEREIAELIVKAIAGAVFRGTPLSALITTRNIDMLFNVITRVASSHHLLRSSPDVESIVSMVKSALVMAEHGAQDAEVHIRETVKKASDLWSKSQHSGESSVNSGMEVVSSEERHRALALMLGKGHMVGLDMLQTLAKTMAIYALKALMKHGPEVWHGIGKLLNYVYEHIVTPAVSSTVPQVTHAHVPKELVELRTALKEPMLEMAPTKVLKLLFDMFMYLVRNMESDNTIMMALGGSDAVSVKRRMLAAPEVMEGMEQVINGISNMVAEVFDNEAVQSGIAVFNLWVATTDFKAIGEGALHSVKDVMAEAGPVIQDALKFCEDVAKTLYVGYEMVKPEIEKHLKVLETITTEQLQKAGPAIRKDFEKAKKQLWKIKERMATPQSRMMWYAETMNTAHMTVDASLNRVGLNESNRTEMLTFAKLCVSSAADLAAELRSPSNVRKMITDTSYRQDFYASLPPLSSEAERIAKDIAWDAAVEKASRDAKFKAYMDEVCLDRKQAPESKSMSNLSTLALHS